MVNMRELEAARAENQRLQNNIYELEAEIKLLKATKYQTAVEKIQRWLKHKPNTKVFKLYATERSGHHSVMLWLVNQSKRIKTFVPPEKDVVETCDYSLILDNLHLDCSDKHDIDHRLDEFRNIVILAYEHGDINQVKSHTFGGYIPTQEIVCLRDFKNTLASLLANSGGKQIPNIHNRAKLWEDRAEYVISDQAYFINYNRYNSEKEYRQKICKDLGLYFTDFGFDYITTQGGGSSFTGTDAAAFERDQLNKRYVQYQQLPQFQQYLGHYKKCMQMSKELFGEV